MSAFPLPVVEPDTAPDLDGPFAELARALAGRVLADSRPRAPSAHVVPGGVDQLFVVNGSRLGPVPGGAADLLDALAAGDADSTDRALVRLGVAAPPAIDDRPLTPPLRALSLAVAQKCNLDGPRESHDRLRPFKGGAGSYDRILARVRPLLDRQRRMQVSARVTVTPENLNLPAALDQFVGLGFHSVGFSPLLRAPNGRNEMGPDHLRRMLEGIIACGLAFERKVLTGERYPFLNMTNALRELRRGTHRPYPCGAGAGYLGVSADGELAACHRFVGGADGAVGDLTTGIDHARRDGWLTARAARPHRIDGGTGAWRVQVTCPDSAVEVEARIVLDARGRSGPGRTRVPTGPATVAVWAHVPGTGLPTETRLEATEQA